LDHVEGNTNLAGSGSGDASSPNDADPSTTNQNGAALREPATPSSAPSPETSSAVGRWLDKQKDRITAVNGGVTIFRNAGHGFDKAFSAGA